MSESKSIPGVWIFVGDGGRLPSGVFTTRENAEAWIAKYSLSGLLTRYPLDVSVYDWARENGFEKREHGADRIGRFSSAYLEHHHYEKGIRVA